MARNDPGWAAFHAAFSTHLKSAQMSADRFARDLSAATATEVPSSMVANWRYGKATPPLSLLPSIAKLLSMGRGDADEYDPLYLPRRMGVIGAAPPADRLVDAAFELEKLETMLRAATERVALSGRSRGASDIVQAAMATGEWAVAVYPAIEGPKDCRMYAADRIDFRRIDGREIGYKDVWDVPELRDAIRASNAVPSSRGPRWSAMEDDGSAGHESRVSWWSIMHIGCPTPPYVPVAYPGLTSVSVASVTMKSWVNEVASLLAMALGYGASSTRGLALTHAGPNLDNESDHDRLEIHDRFLRRPPERRVWSHFVGAGTNAGSPFAASDGFSDETTVHFWLREDDYFLETFADSQQHATELKLQRDAVDRILEAESSTRVRVIPIEARASLEERWAQVLRCVLDALRHLDDRGLLPRDLAQVHPAVSRREGSAADSLFSWLRANDCPGFLRGQ